MSSKKKKRLRVVLVVSFDTAYDGDIFVGTSPPVYENDGDFMWIHKNYSSELYKGQVLVVKETEEDVRNISSVPPKYWRIVTDETETIDP